MTYNAYDRFLEAVKKLPRWSNARRRPIDSNTGKIVRSVIEEIAAVEDAILEYKRQFFLDYYIGKEDTILDYIYYAQVGDIEDISAFAVIDPAYAVTEEETDFYNDRALALYKNGYLFLYETNENNKLQYTYQNVAYKADIKEQAVWNIFDEYAWWFGLERFTRERNASLLQRCLNQFKTRPNSTEEGIRNAIYNAAAAKIDLIDNDKEIISPLSKEEIQFLEPNEETLSKVNEDGITLYEEISRFNRDIARTRKWDMDYWDNAFRKLKYLPHKWDADVNIYRDGVGYHDALKVTTLKNVGQESMTDVEIYGFVRSADEIDTYLKDNNVQQEIGLKLTKYDNLINPVSVPCKIEAEDLIPIEHPEQVKFTFYNQIREGTYDLDDFVINANNVIVNDPAALELNSCYEIQFSPKDDSGEALNVYCCNLINEEISESILVARDNYQFRGSGIVDTNILFHGDNIADFLEPDNLINAPGTGFTLKEPLKDGLFKVNLKNWTGQSLEINVDPDSGWQEITSSLVYVEPKGFTYQSGKNRYVSQEGTETDDKLVLTFAPHMCRKLSFYLDTDAQTDDAVNAAYKFEYIDSQGKTKAIDSVPYKKINNGYTVTFDNKNHFNDTVVVTIGRHSQCTYAINVSQIRRQSYWFEFDIKHNDSSVDHSLNNTNILTIPQNCPENSVLYCTIHSGQNPVPPVIRYVHIGPKPTGRNNYYVLFETGNAGPYKLDIKTNYDVTLINRNTGIRTENYTTRKTYSYNTEEHAVNELYLDLSAFDTVYKTAPAVKKKNVLGSDVYVLPVNEEISEIYIEGTGYQENKSIEMTLADIVNLEPDEKLYAAHSYPALIRINQTEKTCALVPLKPNDLPDSDRICIIISDMALQVCFKADNIDHFTNTFDTDFDYFYLYNAAGQKYIAYQKIPVTNQYTETTVIPVFSPAPKEMAQLIYKISNTWPDQDTHLYYMQGYEERDWTVFHDDILHIDMYGLTAEELAKNISVFDANTSYTGKKCQLGNTIPLSDIIQDSTLLSRIGEYIITPPDKMDVVYQEQTYTQVAYEDGAALYVELDGFNKLRYANILRINKIKIDDVTYDTEEAIGEILTLVTEAGIICWTDLAPYGGLIEYVEYVYKEPVSLRYKSLDDLYTIARYAVDYDRNINLNEYKETNVADGQEIKIDMSRFKTTPDNIVAVCSNPCFYGTVVDDIVRVSKIAEDNTPVIHNGFYYVDGKEYYFFSHQYPIEKNRWNGIEIDNANIIDHKLYMYQEAVNYLQNSKMECNHLDIHCIVDFKKDRARTNIDPMGHIGACESYTMWNDYHANRTLSNYKNGYATEFTMQDDGYAMLDITSFLAGHTTISCLYTGRLTFALAQEIRILDEQALQSVYCKPAQDFIVDEDIAYCIPENIDTNQYRYYLVVTGNGTLDEVLIHDFTKPDEIAAHHVKAIDKLGLTVEETNTAKAETAIIEYDASFMKYNQLETDRQGILRVGATADWNITKIHSYDLSSCRTTQCLYRSGALITQKDGATIETEPVEIQYRKSIYKAAIKLNQYIAGNRKDFAITVYSSSSKNGTYKEIGRITDDNLVTFPIKQADRFIKCRIVAAEDKAITDIDFFVIYKESGEEDLPVFDYTEGSSVTRIFSIGAAGNYKFRNVLCDEEYDQYGQIYIRDIRKAPNGEYVWGSWKNTADNPGFNNCELFQFKIVLQNKAARLKINGFEFEVL